MKKIKTTPPASPSKRRRKRTVPNFHALAWALAGVQEDIRPFVLEGSPDLVEDPEQYKLLDDVWLQLDAMAGKLMAMHDVSRTPVRSKSRSPK